jgi:hypothetical protein
MTADQAEVDDDDDRRDGQAIADGGEGPCIAGVSLVDQAADAAAFEVCGETGKERAPAAVRTAFVPAAADGR